ncbi:MAG: hypothetical protein ACRD2C_17155 [Acidimicrobiales bacterium]
MRFTADAHPGLASGAITLTFRAWSRPQAKVGGRYQAAEVTLLVDDVREVRVGDITDDEARRAGAEDRAGIVTRLAGRPAGRYAPAAKRDITDDTLVWRVAFHRVAPDPTPVLAEQDDLAVEDVAEITRRLDRLDAASAHGPWARETLRLIADRPAVVSTVLAEALGRERQPFKIDVRKLKRLGLTLSLDVGYRLSPRGEAYLRAVVPRT